MCMSLSILTNSCMPEPDRERPTGQSGISPILMFFTRRMSLCTLKPSLWQSWAPSFTDFSFFLEFDLSSEELLVFIGSHFSLPSRSCFFTSSASPLPVLGLLVARRTFPVELVFTSQTPSES